ncbi:MAG TPA: serine/threonine-protein kinase [Drouetiella sp.]
MSLAQASLIGATIADRYIIEDEIGAGALGVVYRARHKVLERPVAVKILYEDLKGNENSFLRFQREAQAASSLNHPNIVTIFDFGLQDNSYPYLVMDYLQGENLKDLIQRQGRVPLDRAFPILMQIADALSHAHTKGILHRDIKPDNIILQQSNVSKDIVKIVDFGIAKKINERKNEKLTMEGQVVGTPAFMSPEQILNGHLDARSDIYAFGVLTFNLVTGVLPIIGRTPVETMSNHVSAEPLTLAQACPGVAFPSLLQDFLKKIMKKFPDERHKTMEDVKHELQFIQKPFR